ncbi:hypothetical protein AN1V17_23830 [Vallitalea sediminicola]
MIDSEKLILIIKRLIKKEIRLPLVLGTIKGGKVKFDGEDTTSHKNYKKLNNITLNEDDRVLLAKVSGTFIILGKLT